MNHMKKRMKFECQNNFMIRTPALPFKYLNDFERQSKDIYEYVRENEELDTFFRKALLIASPSLYQSYIEKPQSIKKYNNLKHSLLKYFIRSTVRTTPYGYFASVGMGHFSDKTNMEINNQIVDLKVDNEWANNVIYEIEVQEHLYRKLKFKFNTTCYRSGNRYKNPYFSNYGRGKQDDDQIITENSIKYSPLIDIVKDVSKEFTYYEDIKKKIILHYDGINEELVDITLKELIENEYLLSELRIPAYCEDSLKHILHVLESVEYGEEKYYHLLNLKKDIDEFKEEGSQIVLEQAYNRMKLLFETTNYFALNLGYRYSNSELSSEVKNKIEALAEILSSLYVKYDTLKKFKEEFMEKYGTNVEVPLIDIIDVNNFNGLSYLEDVKINEDDREKGIQRVFRDRIEIAALNGNKNVFLYRNDFLKFIDENEKFVKSFDINIFVTHNNSKYGLYVGPNIGSNRAGNMVQRFVDCLDQDEINLYNQLYDNKLLNIEDEYMLVELRDFPVSGRNRNIINNNKNYKYYITFACCDEKKEEITIDDIYMSLSRDGKIFLKSKKYGKKIKFVTDNMLNSRLNNKIAQLLKRIAQDSEKYPEDRLFLPGIKYKYVPRIVVEDIVISPRKWTFGIEDISVNCYEEFKNEFNKIVKEYQMDEELYYVIADNRMIVNIQRDDDMHILFLGMKRNKQISFQEIEENLFKGAIVKNVFQEKLINECVFSVISSDKIEHSNITSVELCDDKRSFLLGDDGWIYFKLYGIQNRSDEIIGKYIFALLEKLDNPDHFFIRYYDNKGEHLRIRIKFNNEHIAYSKLEVIINWAKGLINSRVINSIIFDIYEREINRYGGKEVIEACERVFFKDSKLIESFYAINKKMEPSILEEYYIKGIAFILRNLTDSEDEMFSIINMGNYSAEKYRKKYRKNHKKYINYINEILDDKANGYFTNIEALDEKEALINYKFQLKEQFANGKCTNDYFRIVNSIMHMYCNRLTGNRELEEEYFALVRHALYHIKERSELDILK